MSKGIGIDADLATFRMISVLRQRGASWREIGSASGKSPQVAKRDAKRLAARLRARSAEIAGPPADPLRAEAVPDDPPEGGCYFPLEDAAQ